MHLVEMADRTPAAQAWSAYPQGAAGGEFAAWLAAWLAVLSAAGGAAVEGAGHHGGPGAAEGGLHPGTAAGVRRPPGHEEGSGRPPRVSPDSRIGTADAWNAAGGASRVWPFTGAAAYPLSPGVKGPVPRDGGPVSTRDDPLPETDRWHLECLPALEVLLFAAATPTCVVVPVAGPKVWDVQAAAGCQASQTPPEPFSAVTAMEGYVEGPGPALPGAGSRAAVVVSRPAERSGGVPGGGVRGSEVLSGTGGRQEGAGQPEGHLGAVPFAGASATEDRITWGPGHAREGAVPAGTTRSAPVGRTGGPHGEAAAVATVGGSASEEQAAPNPDFAGLGHRPGPEGPMAESGVPAGVAPRPAATGEVGPSGSPGREVWHRLPEVRGTSERVSEVLTADPWRVGPRDGFASAAKSMFHLAEQAPAAEDGVLTAQAAPASGDPPAGVPQEATWGPQTVPRLQQGPAPRSVEGLDEGMVATGAPRSVDATSAGTQEGGDAAGAAAQAEGRQRDGGSGAVPGWLGTAFEPPASRETPVRGTDLIPSAAVAPGEREDGTGVAAAGPLRVVHEAHHPPEAERVPPDLVPERVLAAVRHLARTGEGRLRMELELDPPGLGRLVVRLAWDDGVLRADFLVASQEARQAVEAFLPRLRESLAGLVTLAETGVWVYSDATASGWWQPARHHAEPLPGTAAPVPEREAQPAFRGRPHGGVLDCLI